MHQLKRFGIVCTMLTGMASHAVLAQTRELTLKDCLQYALQHNQQIAITQYNERTGQEKINETRAQALPQVTAAGSFQDNVQKQVLILPPALAASFGGDGQPIPIALNYQVEGQATLTQQIYNQSVFTALNAAKAGMDYYHMNTALTRTQVIEQVSQLYYRLQVTATQVGTLDSNILNISKAMESTKAQFANGLARKIDVDRLKVNLTNLNTQRTGLLDSITQQGYQLRYAMGMQLDESLELPVFKPEMVENEIGLRVTLDSGMNLNNRLEYTILKKQAELEGYQKKANKAEYYPTVSLTGNYSTNGVSDKLDFIGHGKTAEWYQVGYIALNVNVPIFDGGARRARVHQAQIAIDQYNKEAEQTALQLDVDYRNSKMNLQSSINTIRSQKDNWDLAREVYETTDTNYKQGISSLTDLLDAENSLLTAENNYNGALLQYKLAEIGLIKANGNLNSLLN